MSVTMYCVNIEVLQMYINSYMCMLICLSNPVHLSNIKFYGTNVIRFGIFSFFFFLNVHSHIL